MAKTLPHGLPFAPVKVGVLIGRTGMATSTPTLTGAKEIGRAHV